MTISHTFERPIDQSLFDLLKTLSELSSEAESEKVFSEAENLIARGADVNAKAVNSNIPEGRLPACIFEEWSYNPPFQKLALTRILLASGFDPGLDGGLNGALTLAHYIKLSFPNNEFLSGLKALLRAGCDPSRECLLFDDEFLPDSALSYLDDDFGDVFLIDHDFPTMLGLSAARFCLQKCIERRNYETVGLITQALKSRLVSVRAFGGFKISMTGSDLWTFDRMHGEAFSSGLIFITKSNCICLDPRWGAFCDPELMNMPFDREVDLGIDGEFLTGINGLVGNSPLFRLRFYNNDQVLVIDDWKQTVHRETDTSGLTDACEIFLPNNYGI